MEYMESKMSIQAEGALSENNRLHGVINYLAAALEKIANGNIPDGTDRAISGDWQGLFNAAQDIATTALTKNPEKIGMEYESSDNQDAQRYHWMLNEPEGAMHLLNLLKNNKGSKEDFGRMIDRIMTSQEKSRG